MAQSPPPSPGPVPAPSITLRRVSAIVLFLGIGLLGVPFLLAAAVVGSNSNGVSVLQAMYALWGLGIIVIGLALAIGRM